MFLTSEQTRRILSTISAFESGKAEGDHSVVALLYDGPNGSRQITYGSHQLTQSSGHFRTLIDNYIERDDDVVDLSDWYGKADNLRLVWDHRFIGALKEAGRDPAMQEEQDNIFADEYMAPAVAFCQREGLVHSLSLLVVYDSYIHSGGVKRYLRRRFKECTPTGGGDEKAWVIAYLNTRRRWLANHRKIPILRKTVYRMDTLLHQVGQCNWNLSQPYRTANGVFVK